MGGEITWRCLGTGEYVFTLKVYRDCNGTAMGAGPQQLAVWNHPSLTTIQVNLINQNDLSPVCTPVAGGPMAISCGTPSPGAIEEYVFESNPIFIGGTPPPNGWHFTWHSGFRSGAITNLVNPASKGLTLRAAMYEYQGNNNNPCFDSSPSFYEPPSTTLCVGSSFSYNHNAYDSDLDSLVYSWADPLNWIVGTYNPPTTPEALPFQAGYSSGNPLPGTGINPANVPASLDSRTGEITFTSFTQGIFVLVIKVESWRCGVKIAEVYREIQVLLLNCGGTNSPPNVLPPFPSGFHDTVYAGDLVNFTISATDLEFLQDGTTPQDVTIIPSGSQFGAGYTNPNAGCNNPPCATIAQPVPLTGSQAASIDVSWQTDCNHLGNSGCTVNGSTYNFTFRVKDNYCAIPGSSVITASITVLAPPPLPPPDMNCVNVLPNGDVELTWTSVIDTTNSFEEYRIFSAFTPAGPFVLVGTATNIAQNTFTHIGADADNGSINYFVQTVSGCGIQPSENSDTLSSIYLQAINPGNGTVQLQWNPIANPALTTSVPTYNVYQEYPIGTWTLIKQVPFGTNSLIDTISVCSDSLNWKIEVVDNSGCISGSNIDGDWFQDLLPPTPPDLTHVTVDTTNGIADLTWKSSPSMDTDGYIIYQFINGGWIVVDTIYGINNTNYSYLLSNANGESELFGIAAFDTCWTGIPASPNTSPIGLIQKSVFLQVQKDICGASTTLRWNRYINWQSGGVSRYRVYASINGGIYSEIATVTNGDTSLIHSGLIYNNTYCYIVRAENDGLNTHVISNISCVFLKQPPKPLNPYLRTVTVLEEDIIQLRLTVDKSVFNTGFMIERSLDPNTNYQTLASYTAATIPFVITDEGYTQEENYFYRIISLDSCGAPADTSNLGSTILLTSSPDNENLDIRLHWNGYVQWNGNVREYRLYRSINGVFDPVPIAVLPPNAREYVDNVEHLIGTNANGEFCYKIEAVENINAFGFSETSMSNESCSVIQELVFIPNAMVIGGVNNVFLPVINFARFDEYRLMIFNRWGDKVFESTEHTVGWDGLVNGKTYSTDNVYVYMITLRNGEGKFLEYRGSLTVLRN